MVVYFITVLANNQQSTTIPW